MRLSTGVLASLLALGSCAPSTKYAVHEKRAPGISGWTRRDIKLDRRTVLPISIALTQENLDKGYDFLMEVSDPNSPSYASHWTQEKIAETFAPKKETVEAVRLWLAEHGVTEDRITISKSLSWIRFESTVGEAEDLLQTKYRVYEHPETKKPHVACDEYSLPAHITEHVDFVSPTIGFEAFLTKTRSDPTVQKRDENPLVPVPQPANGTAPPPPPSAADVESTKPRTGVVAGAPKPWPNDGPSVAAALDYCSTTITPDCLRALYGFPIGSLAKSSFGIVEFTPDSYLQSDLDLFYVNLATNVPVGTTPILDSIDGGTANRYDPNNNLESNLDLQYAIALVHPQKVTLYQVGDFVEGGSNNLFLDAIDGSYCTYSGGDSSIDPVYPDPYSGGYKGPKNCGGFAATSVISVSWGQNEGGMPLSYMVRQCNEYMKLGLLGVTIIYSSGDHGVAGNGNKCCYYQGCYGGYMNPAGAGGAFNPTWPGTCPYITSVGATQIVPGAKITAKEVACTTQIYSGGGFSNVFSVPSYQSSAVATYFKKYKPSYSALYYNSAGTGRGIPDISANGANYLCAIDGTGVPLFGTSASAPTVGSIITHINEQRINKGKSPVGFINPVLYANPKALNDITTGNNPGCGTNGFSAVKGWDPVTGLGTPNYPKLLKIWLALP